MMCEKCGKRTANIHVSQIVNGMAHEQHLCSECAQMNIQIGEGSPLGFLDEMLKGIYQYNTAGIPQNMMSAGVQAGGSASNDYSHLEALGLKLPAFEEECTETKETSELPQIEQLKTELKEAIKNEEYEKAAQIKRSILEEEGKGD